MASGLDPGPAVSAAQQLQQANAAMFSAILSQQMEGQTTVQEAVMSFSEACRTHAQDLRYAQHRRLLLLNTGHHKSWI